MTRHVIDWAVAAGTFPGEQRSGDLHAVINGSEQAKIAVVDGLGHGDPAADAAEAAIAVFEKNGANTVERLVSQCHERLSSTRGAALCIVNVDGNDDTLTWLGVGNVMALLVHDDRRFKAQCRDLLIRSGIVGSQLPALASMQTTVRPGEVLILATDGIHPRFVETVQAREDLQHQADRILADYRLADDDALVAVIRYNGVRAGNDDG